MEPFEGLEFVKTATGCRKLYEKSKMSFTLLDEEEKNITLKDLYLKGVHLGNFMIQQSLTSKGTAIIGRLSEFTFICYVS